MARTLPKADTNELILLTAIYEQLERIADALAPEPAPAPEPKPAPQKRTPRKTN